MQPGAPPGGSGQGWWGGGRTGGGYPPSGGVGWGPSAGGYGPSAGPGWGQPQHTYGPGYGPSGAAPQKDGRLVTLGIVCLVLGILKLLWVLYEIGSSAFAVFAFEAMISLVHATKVVLPVAATKALSLVEDMVLVTAFTTMGRMLPFGVLAAVQIYLGAKVYGARPSALHGLRKLAWWSLGAIAVSLLVQGIFVIPAQVEFTRRLLDDVLKAIPWPGGASPVAGWSPPSPVWSVTKPLLIAAGQLTWPIVLWIWTGRLLESTGRR